MEKLLGHIDHLEGLKLFLRTALAGVANDARLGCKCGDTYVDGEQCPACHCLWAISVCAGDAGDRKASGINPGSSGVQSDDVPNVSHPNTDEFAEIREQCRTYEALLETVRHTGHLTHSRTIDEFYQSTKTLLAANDDLKAKNKALQEDVVRRVNEIVKTDATDQLAAKDAEIERLKDEHAEELAQLRAQIIADVKTGRLDY